MTDIYIGYRRDDGGHAHALYEKLLDWYDAGQVFLDRESLASDAKFSDELDQAVQDCQVLLAVIGPQWLSYQNRERLQDTDDITRGEIRAALRHGKPVIPVLVGGAGFPPETALPDDICGISASNAHHQREKQYQISFHKLLATLEKYHGLIPRYRRRDCSSTPFRVVDLPLTRYFSDPAGHLPELRRLFEEQNATAVTVHGIGGIGKTQLALEYSHVFRTEYAGVWWFRAETPDQIELDCREMCGELGISSFEGELHHQTVMRWLKTQPRWLLVYDNAENKGALYPYLPTAGGHHILITSRNRDWNEVALALGLNMWNKEQALDFLRHRLENADDDERRQLTRTLGGLPLALKQACTYILKQHISIETYGREVENWQRENPLRDHKDAISYPYSVLTALSLSFDKLEEPARQLLRLCAWFAPEPIPERLFREHADLLTEELKRTTVDDLAWNETVTQLESHALIQRSNIPALDRQPGETREETALTLHRPVQEAVHARLTDKAADSAMAAALLRSAYPFEAKLPKKWPACAALLPHVRQLQVFYTQGWVDAVSMSWLLDRAATYLQYGLTLYREALNLFEAALEIARKDLGEKHPATLTLMSDLAVLLEARGDLHGALALQEKALDGLSHVLDGEHPDTLTSMCRLAGTLHALGDLPGARALQEKTLDIRRRVLGEEDPDTLTSMNILAAAFRALDDLPNARALHEKVLDIRRRVLGEENPDTLTSMNNLAMTLHAQGDLPGARTLHEKTLDIRRRVLGGEHPATLASMNNLALTLHKQGDLPGARDLQEKTLDIRHRVLGKEHPDTLASMNNLALTLHAQGDFPGARDLEEKSLDIRRRVLGKEHPDTFAAMNHLASIYLTQDSTTQARALQEEILEIRRRVSGERNKDTTADVWSLLMTLAKIGDLAAATRLVEDNLLWLCEAKESELDPFQQTLSAKMQRLQAALVEQA